MTCVCGCMFCFACGLKREAKCGCESRVHAYPEVSQAPIRTAASVYEEIVERARRKGRGEGVGVGGGGGVERRKRKAGAGVVVKEGEEGEEGDEEKGGKGLA